MKRVPVPSGVLLSLALCAAPPLMAGSSSVQVTVTATVIAEPCEINGGSPVNVEFGNNLMTTDIDGVNYEKPIDYSLECNTSFGSDVKMMISGVGVGGNGEYLQAGGVEDLAIALKANGSDFPLNSWLNFTYPDKPQLAAVPVNLRGSKLTAGEFNATATMKVEYQ